MKRSVFFYMSHLLFLVVQGGGGVPWTLEKTSCQSRCCCCTDELSFEKTLLSRGFLEVWRSEDPFEA